MRLTAKQKWQLKDIWLDELGDETLYWTEPTINDNKQTIAALARRGLLRLSEDGLFQMTPEGVEAAKKLP